MTWTVVPRVSSTDSNASDVSLGSTEPMSNSQVLPISVEEDISQELFNLVLQDDEESGYCIVSNASKGFVTDDMKAIVNKVNEPDGSLGEFSKTVSNGTNSNKSSLLAGISGEQSLNTAGKGLVSPNTSPEESSKGTADVPKLCFPVEDAAADETNYIYRMIKDDMVELQYEIDLRLAKNLEMKHMKADGNSLFAAVALQVYGDPDLHDMTRRNCVSFMVDNQPHFSQFVPGDITSYCLRKSRDKEYGAILEAHALAHAYNRPVHIYFYCTEPFTAFHPPLAGNSTPIRLSSHYGGHYNSLIELPNEHLFGRPHGGNPANVPRSTAGNSFEADDSEDDDDAVMAALLNYVAGGEIPIGGNIIIGSDPDDCFNSCELALKLGFNSEEVATAYRIFGEDGTSMLHHLIVNDTYDSYDYVITKDTCSIM